MIRRHIRAKHHERGIAVAFAQITEQLLVSAIFFDDVPNVFVKDALHACGGGAKLKTDQRIIFSLIVLVMTKVNVNFAKGSSPSR